jgi:signal transduction histidine kinase
LPLTQQIVVAHGGSIICKPRHPTGTTFEIWLPAATRAANGSAVRRVG